jgi:hypothetical protein
MTKRRARHALPLGSEDVAELKEPLLVTGVAKAASDEQRSEHGFRGNASLNVGG